MLKSKRKLDRIFVRLNKDVPMSQDFKFNEEIIYRKVGAQKILVPIGQNIEDVRSIFTLNESAAFILDGLIEKQNLNQIATNLMNEFDDLSQEDAMESINEIIRDFKEHNILL
jgi:hypothetical protein